MHLRGERSLIFAAQQDTIPRKDAAILANCDDPAVRRVWVEHVITHDVRNALGECKRLEGEAKTKEKALFNKMFGGAATSPEKASTGGTGAAGEPGVRRNGSTSVEDVVAHWQKQPGSGYIPASGSFAYTGMDAAIYAAEREAKEAADAMAAARELLKMQKALAKDQALKEEVVEALAPPKAGCFQKCLASAECVGFTCLSASQLCV